MFIMVREPTLLVREEGQVPQLGALLSLVWLGGFPDYRKKKRYPYSKLSTRGPKEGSVGMNPGIGPLKGYHKKDCTGSWPTATVVREPPPATIVSVCPNVNFG